MLKKLWQLSDLTSSEPDTHEFYIPGIELPVRTRRNNRAKRMSIRVDQKKYQIILTLPRRESLNNAKTFAFSQTDWLQKQLSKLPKKITLKHQSPIPLLGQIYYINHQKDKLRGLVTLKDDQLYIPGFEDMIEQRLIRFLKKYALTEIEKRAHQKARAISAEVAKVMVKDTKSRWGSCSSSGDLCFSWRLIMAPEYVLDYVISHEIAHLRFMNHSKSFWELCYDLSVQGIKGRQWLKTNGHKLYHFQN